MLGHTSGVSSPRESKLKKKKIHISVSTQTVFEVQAPRSPDLNP